MACLITGCTSGGAASTSTSKPTSTSASSNPAPTATSSPTSTPVVGPTGSQPAGSTVPLTSKATFADDVTGQVDGISAVTVSAGAVPGQSNGPALLVKITIRNGSTDPINLDSAVVSLLAGAQRTPGDPVDGSPTAPFAGDLGAGQQKTARYAFRVDNVTPGPVQVTVSYSPVKRPLTFSGSW